MCYGPGILRFCNKSVLSRRQGQLCGTSRLQPDQQECWIALVRKCALSRTPVSTVPNTWPRAVAISSDLPPRSARRLTPIRPNPGSQIYSNPDLGQGWVQVPKKLSRLFSPTICILLFIFIIFITFIYGLTIDVHSPLSYTYVFEKRYLKLTVTSSEFSVVPVLSEI